MDIKSILISTIVVTPSICFFKQLYNTYMVQKEEEKNARLFYQRHNCVVTYGFGTIRGWPPETIELRKDNIYQLLDPHLYFINSAKKSLDIAIMILSIDQVFDALIEARKRGVKIRLLVNFFSNKNSSTKFNKLFQAGVELAYFISKEENLDSIMHWKCMVKDYDESDGYLCIGSMNLANIASALHNFEDIVFTTNRYMLEPFHEEFEKCWNIIRKENKTNFNRTILLDSKFLL